MQVHHDEGVAIYIDPEPCVGVDGDEASKGVRFGAGLLSAVKLTAPAFIPRRHARQAGNDSNTPCPRPP